MEKVKLDERGRLTLPKEMRDQIRAKEFMVVRAGHMFIFHPIAKDPLRHWQEVWKGVPLKSLAEEKRMIREAMQKDILGE